MRKKITTVTALALCFHVILSLFALAYVLAATHDLSLSFSPDRSGAVPLQGETVSGDIYVFTSPETGISQVSFYLDDPGMAGSPIQVERLAPYDFAGSSPDQSAALPYDTAQLSDGVHEITELIELSGGGSEIVSSTFTVANNIVLPFSDNFQDGIADGWWIVDGSGNLSNWQVINGEYHEQNFVGRIGTSLDGTYHLGTYSFLRAGMGLTNYRLSVDVIPLLGATVDQHITGNDVGIMFRYQNNDNYYRISFNSNKGFSRLEKKVGGIFTTLAENSRGYVDGQLLNIVLEVNGPLIQVYVNGDGLFSIYDTSLTSGTIALYCQDRTIFDNVLIERNSTAPSIVISTPGAYSVETSGNFDISVIALNVPSGGWVDLLLDGASCGAVSEFLNNVYTATCQNVISGEHTVDAIVDDSVSEIIRDTNTRVGVLGDSYITVGDSITNGKMDNYSSDNISSDGRIISFGGFQSNLDDLLTATRLYPNIVFNEGVPGDESWDAASTRINSILERHPGSNYVLILLGTNDSGGALPVLSGLGCSGQSCDGTYKQNMQTLVDAIVVSGKTPVVALIPPAFDSPDPLNSNRNQLIQEYNSVIKNELTNIALGPDFFSFFLSNVVNRSSLFSDVVHPNGLGNVVMAYLWHNALTGSTFLPFIMEDIVPANYKQNLIELGDKYYIDEAYTLINILDNGIQLDGIPAELMSGRWIMTANSDKNNSAINFLSFYADRAVTVYVAYDSGAATLPNWLSTFKKTALQLSTTDPAAPLLDLYRADNMSGNITLGGNQATGASGAFSNYVVIVVAN